jgi:ParB-like chromosome segregation protein Spo0J
VNIINKPIGDIKPYDKNPRNNAPAIDKVAASIKEFGFKVPLVIDKEGVIITGHTRLLAALKLGMAELPCVLADDLTPEQVKAFRIADNKVGEFATWDESLLLQEINDLKLADYDTQMTGFSAKEIAMLQGDLEADEDGFDP